MLRNTTDLDAWRRLFDVAVRVRQMAPWHWMDETDVFAVQDPAGGNLGFVSVMGALGEHLAVAVYSGAPALHDFWKLQDEDGSLPPEHIIDLPQLQAMFLNRAALSREDRDLVKLLGLTLRGEQSCPCFRSYRPGYMPWFLEHDEIETLTHALQQLLDVAPRFRKDPAILQPGDSDDMYLMRVARHDAGGLSWEDQPIRVASPTESPAPALPAEADVEKLAAYPLRKATIEVDFFPLLAGIQEKKDQRPTDPYMLLFVDSDSGLVIATELLVMETTLSDLWARLPLLIGRHLVANGSLASDVAVRSLWLLKLLLPISQRLRISVALSNELPALEAAREDLRQSLQAPAARAVFRNIP